MQRMSYGRRPAALQNLIPSFPWIAPGWRAGGAIQGKEGIKFCHLATMLQGEGAVPAGLGQGLRPLLHPQRPPQDQPHLPVLAQGLQRRIPGGDREGDPCERRQDSGGEPDGLHHLLRLHVHHEGTLRVRQAHLHGADGVPGTDGFISSVKFIS